MPVDIKCPNLRDRRVAASDSRRHDARRRQVQAIILHQTGVFDFLPGTRWPYPADPATDAQRRSYHRLDAIPAHFVVINDGTIFYTHDVDFLSRSAGGQVGIDIEFAGNYSLDFRLSAAAIRSGRALVTALKEAIPSIRYIHPHGQVQHVLMDAARTPCGGTTGRRCGKLDSDPGPDVWVNVGEWAARHLGLQSETTLSSYQNNGISPAQRDARFSQAIL